MPSPYCVDDFKEKFDSLYRLVIVASARSIQLAKTESRGFGSSLRSQKSTVKALEEVLNGKLSYINSGEEDEVLLDYEE
jgi:DNA-directed RNA polymerase omega subunit